MGQGVFDFQGEVVLVTGAARGIGRSMVRQFSDAGAMVIGVDRDFEGLVETRKQCPECDTYVIDIREDSEIRSLMEYIKKRFGRLDVCLNNAAVAPHADLLTYPDAVWERVYDINCKGTFFMTRAVAELMKSSGVSGSIINFSSAAALKGSSGSGAYASSRAAVESFSRVAAVELAPYGIRVNTIRPGLIDTQPKPLPLQMRENLEKRIPSLLLQRAGTAEEVGNVALFLASSLASYMTGAVVTVDGGSLCGNFPSQQVVDDDSRYQWLYE